MNKVYGYCRVALMNNEEMNQQCKIIKDYCKNKGLGLDECFCDNGVSGLKTDRTNLQRMLNVLQQGDIVVIKDIARLTRDIRQYITLTKQIYDIGTTLIVIDQPDLKFDVI